MTGITRVLSKQIGACFVIGFCGWIAGCNDSSSTNSNNSTTATASNGLPLIHHVFVISLENKSFQEAFGSGSGSPYLAQQLTAQGTLLNNYYAIGHNSLPNYIAMISGQGPNGVTQGDCAVYLDFVPGSSVQFDSNGQAVGSGCVYPTAVDTLPNQLAAAQFSWRGYMEGIPGPCTHPALNRTDPYLTASSSNEYVDDHNPFIFFHSLVDSASCIANDVPLTQLTSDLAQEGTTPNYVFIAPNVCHDSHDTPCADGEPGGLVSADTFLRNWVPQVMNSAAYKDDGMIVILFDEADADSSACCGEQSGPNTSLPGINGPGGGRVGAVVLSKHVRAGNVVTTYYNHYSLLRTIEDLFGVARLGYAANDGVNSFGSDVFTQ